MPAKIYLGFPGVGKTTYCKDILKDDPNAEVFDIDFNHLPLSAGIKPAVNFLKETHDKCQNRIIFLSTGWWMRSFCKRLHLEYTFIIPDISLKEEYLRRYIERKNPHLPSIMEKEWDNYINSCLEDPSEKIILHSSQFVSDVLTKGI